MQGSIVGQVEGKTVKVTSLGKKDKHEWMIGIVYRDEDCVNTAMVREGWAWYYPEHYESESLADAEQQARKSKRGLWKHPDPLSPSEWQELCKTEGLSGGVTYKFFYEEDATVAASNFIRKGYRIYVPRDISEPQLRVTLLSAFSKKAIANPDIDAIVIVAYEEVGADEKVVDFTPIGMVGWSAGGNWDNTPANIAKTNDRSSYKYYIEIQDEFRNKEIWGQPGIRD